MRKIFLIMICVLCTSLLVGCGSKNNGNMQQGTGTTLGTSSAVNDGNNSIVTDSTNIIQGGISMAESGMDRVENGVETGISDAERAMDPDANRR